MSAMNETSNAGPRAAPSKDSAVQDILSKASKYLFPKDLIVNRIPPRRKTKVPKGNGGWGDLRDQVSPAYLGIPLYTVKRP